MTFPSVDRVEWLNSLIDKVWPHFGRWLQQVGRIDNILLLYNFLNRCQKPFKITKITVLAFIQHTFFTISRSLTTSGFLVDHDDKESGELLCCLLFCVCSLCCWLKLVQQVVKESRESLCCLLLFVSSFCCYNWLRRLSKIVESLLWTIFFPLLAWRRSRNSRCASQFGTAAKLESIFLQHHC